MTQPDLGVSDADFIGIVGSPTSTHTLHVDLVGDSGTRPINGQMVVVAPLDRDGVTEYGIGTVTGVEQRNRYHEDPALRGVIASRGGIPGLTGRADIKTATVAVQAVFRPEGPVGGAMTFAPSTGDRVHLANAALLTELAQRATSDLFFLGHAYRQNIVLPLSLPDYSGSRGASHGSFFGPSGSGKTRLAAFTLASQLRHLNMGVLLIDPQGQFSTTARVRSEVGVDIRRVAADQGRRVHALSIAREVRLPEDEDLFTGLLVDGRRNFFQASSLLGVTGSEKAKDVQEMVTMWLANRHGWSDGDVELLLDDMVEFVRDQATTGSIYSGIDRGNEEDLEIPENDDKPANRLYHNLNAVLSPGRYPHRDGAGRRASLLSALADVFPLFTEHGPGGASRVPVEGIVTDLCDSELGGAPRPLYVLSLVDPEARGWTALEGARAQSTILRVLLSRLEAEAQDRYLNRPNHPANVLVFLDEAARFASPKSNTTGGRDIAEDLARYMREIRKYAVGFYLVLQEPAALHDSIWKQLRNGFQVFAGGLVGSDLERVREQVGSPETMRLYGQLAQPSATNPVYPFMLCGNLSPLSATSAPMFMQAFTDPEQWVRVNRSYGGWLPGHYHAEDVWVR